MAVALAWKRIDRLNRHRVVLMKYTYGNGDTTVTVATGLKIIYSWHVSQHTVSTKTILQGTVSGGTITLTVTDPLASAYLFVTAFGI